MIYAVVTNLCTPTITELSFANRSDERLTLETSAFKLFTVANFRYQLS